jgi:cytochrome P450
VLVIEASSTAEHAEPPFFNPFDPATRSDPYPMYRRLLEEDPVHLTPLGFWVFTRHADCLAVFKDLRFSNDSRRANVRTPLTGSETFDPQLLETRPFLFTDPPDHTRLRGLVSKAFTARVVERLEPRVQQLVDELLDQALGSPEMELIGDLAYPLPVQVICELLGVPPSDHETFRDWSAALARGLDPDLVLSPDEIAQRNAGVAAFRDYFKGLIEVRRRKPSDDLLSRLVEVEDAGEVLSEAELLTTCILLLVAGHETTVNLIGNGALALMRNPDQLELLRRDPSLWRGAIEELLRYDPPVQIDGRTALEDVEVAGTRVEAGSFVMMAIAAANRDPAVFPDPDRLDVRRTDLKHLSFGFGTHFCLGAPLARLEGRVALSTLVRRAGTLELLDTAPAYKDNVVLRGLQSLRLDTGSSR